MPQPRTMLTQEELDALLQIVARAPLPYLTSHTLIGKMQMMMNEAIEAGNADIDADEQEKEHVE